MTEHVVRFEIAPAPEITKEAVIHVTNPRKAMVRASSLPTSVKHSTAVYSGVRFDVYLKARDLDDAVLTAAQIVEDLVVEISVLSAARCGTPQPSVAVDIDPKARTHPFRQCVVLDPEISRRFLTPAHIRFLRGGYKHLTGESRMSIRRAMHAYRQAMSTTDPLVEFLLLWVAVEALNVPLGLRRGIRSPKRLEGTKRFFEIRVADGEKLYETAYKLRSRFIHGSRDVEGMARTARETIEQMRVATRDAIASSLDVHWEGDRRSLKNWPVYFVFETTITAPKGAPLGVDGDLPQIRVGPIEILNLTRNGNQIFFQYHIRVDERFGPRVERGTTGKASILGEQVDLSGVEFEAKET